MRELNAKAGALSRHAEQVADLGITHAIEAVRHFHLAGHGAQAAIRPICRTVSTYLLDPESV